MGNCIEGKCDCLDGFSGNLCEKEDLCITSKVTCQNGGICADGSCECLEGFTGNNCEKTDLCITKNINCQNSGICNEGVCECAEGFAGINCEAFDPMKVQFWLNEGLTPLRLYNAGIPLNSLYGKRYQGGLIFYLNPADGYGLVTATSDQSTDIYWGCGTGLNEVSSPPSFLGHPETEEGARIGDGKANTDLILESCTSELKSAAKLCRDLGEEWFFPSRGELDMMCKNLAAKNHGDFASSYYWSSTGRSSKSAWKQAFPQGFQGADFKESHEHVRAVKAFNSF